MWTQRIWKGSEMRVLSCVNIVFLYCDVNIFYFFFASWKHANYILICKSQD